MQWTTEQRYTRLEDISKSELAALIKQVDGSPWRQTYHIQPETGLLNDPNGFSFYNGEYHLFYQWFPLGPVHGIKYWYHTKSKDLVHWENAGIAIRPDSDLDSHGAYSGSGIVHNDQLYLIYTGNTRDEQWVRHPKQNIAIMDKQGIIQKKQKPVIHEVPPGYTDHFRDPKVWKENGLFYAIIGAQRTNLTGCIVLYSSPDMETWTFEGEIKTALPRFGYMWECPDYFTIDGQGVLVFSPQGIAPKGDCYHNIYQSGYVLGNLDVETQSIDHGVFAELDRGFDFYAPQTMEAPDGRRILVGWMGLPEMSYPTDSHGWAHCLTLPREITIENGRLMQRPVRELERLRGVQMEASADLCDEVQTFDSFSGTAFEMICSFELEDADSCGIEIRVSEKEKTVITYDALKQKVHLDRTYSGALTDSPYGTLRSCSLAADKVTFRLFVDSSSLELFINDGAEVFTSRIFPSKDSAGIRFFAKGGRASCQAIKWTIGE
ncbi:sucrose-6-phosphate hydrolase [Domibacillus sp. DTU_2020_1001157_1_SI_ALB_TIR_016]|uniref:glycoside hydrolase family 32 protein n=1 Tax=Domibacillus sp. DTU_2020_1001157_1_SI_ALB_TIR_016 TaxID=3077789 RepID=UPI0028EE69D0|nr:sucrose-6-phosphate hydrolase [Domibacillus sp. DTU_2020_1001157_1_SI_ALB_TIR_016]WNS80505.1 sucrose-6-phosphate hydrolase [Domibacillus sp. DTU_2020_1001157_1_SI_ALB_TIR_016]